MRQNPRVVEVLRVDDRSGSRLVDHVCSRVERWYTVGVWRRLRRGLRWWWGRRHRRRQRRRHHHWVGRAVHIRLVAAARRVMADF